MRCLGLYITVNKRRTEDMYLSDGLSTLMSPTFPELWWGSDTDFIVFKEGDVMEFNYNSTDGMEIESQSPESRTWPLTIVPQGPLRTAPSTLCMERIPWIQHKWMAFCVWLKYTKWVSMNKAKNGSREKEGKKEANSAIACTGAGARDSVRFWKEQVPPFICSGTQQLWVRVLEIVGLWSFISSPIHSVNTYSAYAEYQAPISALR